MPLCRTATLSLADKHQSICMLYAPVKVMHINRQLAKDPLVLLTHTSTATSQSDSFWSVERMMWGARK